MNNKYTLICLLLLSLNAHAQLSNIKIGYQEFPTTITGHAADSAGNMYYSGNFRGQLKVDGKTFENGQGLQDIFLVKTNAAGKVQYTKTFGSKNDDTAPADGLSYTNNNVYLITSIIETVSFQSISVTPYINNLPGSTRCIVNLDTDGNVKWVNKTNLGISKIYASNNIIHVFGQVVPNIGAVKFNDRIIYDSSGYRLMVHLMLDTLGNLINYKSVTPRTTDQSIQNVLYVSTYSDGKLCMLLGPSGNQSFRVGNNTVVLPNILQNYYVLVKTDTAYSSVSSIVLNNNSVNMLNTAGRWQFPLALSKQDSVYLILTSDDPTSFSYNGLNVNAYRRNAFIVLDPDLRAKRIVDLGSSFVGTDYASTNKRRLFFRGVANLNNTLIFTGYYVGANESITNGLTRVDRNFTFLPGLFATVDINGGSRSFMAKATLNFTSASFDWIGDHTPYETSNLDQLFFHAVSDSLITFSFNVDNVWNPWIINGNLKVTSGAMKQNADLADISQYVEYFADGSRIIIGYALGRTALDSVGANFKSVRGKRDVFITRITSAGVVKWYKRFSSTFRVPVARKLTIKDNKAYFLIYYGAGANESNFLTVNDKAYNMGASSGLFASADTSGNITVINLENDYYKSASLNDFNFFSTGNIGLLTGLTYDAYVPNGIFPFGLGCNLLQIDKTSFNIVSGRKIYTDYSLQPDHVEIGNNDRILLSAKLNSSGNIQDQFSTMRIHNGVSFIDSVLIENNVTGQGSGGLGILDMSWNKINWYKRSGGVIGFGLGGEFSKVFFMNDKIFFTGYASISGNGNQAFSWDKKLIIPEMDFQKNYIFKLDSSGAIETYKAIANFTAYNAKKRANGKFVFTGLISNTTNVDTVMVGFDGAHDGLGVVYDSTLNVKGVFRLATPYYETMLDMDIYKDSLVSFVYTAQTEPLLKDYKFSRFRNATTNENQPGIVVTDYAEDAFLSSQVLQPNVALPQQLLSFDARIVYTNIVSVNWKIASEDLRQCVVQRSYNGNTFMDVDIKNILSNSAMLPYQTEDKLNSYGQYYYRLKMISLDGGVSYSDISRVLYTGKTGVCYYDNNSQQLYIMQPVDSFYQYTIFDTGGKTILTDKATGGKIIGLHTQPNGMYIVQIRKPGGVIQSYKFIR